MRATPLHTGTISPRGLPRRAGVTLLEVLVATGILVVGLASIASILPAAGTRLGQATLEDRAGTAAANAYADVVSRGLLSVDIFGSGTTRSAAFGETLPTLANATTSGSFIVASATAAPIVLTSRLDPTRGSALEDDLVYTPPVLGDTPTNSFFNGLAGPREYRPGVCWGALLAPESFPATAGGVATLSVAVFRKPGGAQPLTLNGVPGSSMFQFTSGNSAADESIRKQYLPGCGYVLALPIAAPAAPKWVKITSSWTTNGFGPALVILDLEPLGSSGANLISGGTMNVIAFENVLRVDQYPVSLE